MIVDNALNTQPVIEKKEPTQHYNNPVSQSVSDDDTETLTQDYAGFWIRLGASLIDSILMLVVLIPIALMFFGPEDLQALESAEGNPASLGILGFFLNYILPAVAVILFWAYKSATPGKMLLGLKIVDAKTNENMSLGQMVIRYVGYYPSMLVVGLGFIWAAFDSKKQGWHDKLAGTVVIRNR